MKRTPGGLIDCEFSAQAMQLVAAADGGPLRTETVPALVELAEAGVIGGETCAALVEAWTLQQGLAQLLRSSLDRRSDPQGEPSGFQRRLARIGGSETLEDLAQRVADVRSRAHQAFQDLLQTPSDGNSV